MLLFSNNAEATLAATLTSGATTFTVAADGGADTFGVPDGSQVQLATLTDASAPNAHEVVLITGRSDNVFTVQRGQEDTVAAAWSAGAKISARVTAGMLRTFPQRLNGFLHTRMENPGSPDVCALGDYLTLPRRRASATNGNYYGWHDGSFGAELFGTSAPCDLGEAITWNTSPHYHGAVVVHRPRTGSSIGSICRRRSPSRTPPRRPLSPAPRASLWQSTTTLGRWGSGSPPRCPCRCMPALKASFALPSPRSASLLTR